MVTFEWVLVETVPDSKVHGTNMSGPGGPHVGPMNLAIWAVTLFIRKTLCYVFAAHKNVIFLLLSQSCIHKQPYSGTETYAVNAKVKFTIYTI